MSTKKTSNVTVTVRISLIEGRIDKEMLIPEGSEYKNYSVSFTPLDGCIANQALDVFMGQIPISSPEDYSLTVIDGNGEELAEQLESLGYNMLGTVKEQ